MKGFLVSSSSMFRVISASVAVTVLTVGTVACSNKGSDRNASTSAPVETYAKLKYAVPTFRVTSVDEFSSDYNVSITVPRSLEKISNLPAGVYPYRGTDPVTFTGVVQSDSIGKKSVQQFSNPSNPNEVVFVVTTGMPFNKAYVIYYADAESANFGVAHVFSRSEFTVAQSRLKLDWSAENMNSDLAMKVQSYLDAHKGATLDQAVAAVELAELQNAKAPKKGAQGTGESQPQGSPEVVEGGLSSIE